MVESDVIESILNAIAIYKKIRSTSQARSGPKEYLYVIQSTTLDGLAIYTKENLRAVGVRIFTIS